MKSHDAKLVANPSPPERRRIIKSTPRRGQLYLCEPGQDGRRSGACGLVDVLQDTVEFVEAVVADLELALAVSAGQQHNLGAEGV